MTYAHGAEFTADLSAGDGDGFNSEAFEAVAYNRETKELWVEFKTGNEYVYSDVEESTYNLFVGSPSLGRFYAEHIVGNFPSEKVYVFVYDREPEEEEVNISADSLPRFSVTWQAVNSLIGGQPEYRAVDVDDALRQFNADIASAQVAGFNLELAVKAVTQHFD